MIQKKRLIQFYVSEYETLAKRKTGKLPQYSDFGKNAERLFKSIKRVRPSRISQANLEDYHRQLKNVICYAFRKNKREIMEKALGEIVPLLVQMDLHFLLPEQRDGLNGECLAFLRRTMPGEICIHPMFALYPVYRRYKLTNKITDLVPTRPELEFPETLQMKRHFILHIGPTNSGKTFHSLERLKEAACGVYLGPLRLLALEVYERMKEYGVPCTMMTGQECIEENDSRVTAATIEMADYDAMYDVAVIDEAQMMCDADRGHAWTRAILGIKAKEIHVCASSTAEIVLKHLIGLCNDDWEVRHYERKTALVCEDTPFQFPEHVREGDALIVFSKKSVLDAAGRLESNGIRASVIYGSLPPEIRRRQMRLFTSGKTKVVVATDAIGMGLNLPVRRIVFLQTEKFDGISRRKLNVSEIKQIAGRSGRFGLYDTGYVNALGEEDLEYIRENYEAYEEPVAQVSLGFPQILLDIDDPLDAILKVWSSVAPSQPFVKENVEEALFLYERAKKVRGQIEDFDNKFMLYRMITCPIDIKDRRVVSLWLDYCKTYGADVALTKPVLDEKDRGGLMKYETYYKQLDLYYQFSHRMGKLVDEEWLKDQREETEAVIMRYLSRKKQDYISRCPYCGRQLPLGYPYRVCERCHDKSEIA